MIMTDEEYLWMRNEESSDLDAGAWFKAGTDCYENGWIDAFGLVTPKGRKAMEVYENDRI